MCSFTTVGSTHRGPALAYKMSPFHCTTERQATLRYGKILFNHMARIPTKHRRQILKWLRAGRSVTEVQEAAQKAGWKVSRGTVSTLRQEAKGKDPETTTTPPSMASPPAPPPVPEELPEDVQGGDPWAMLLRTARELDGSKEADGTPSSTGLLQGARLRIRVLEGVASQGPPKRRGMIIEFDGDDPTTRPCTGSHGHLARRGAQRQGRQHRAVLREVLAALRQVRRTGSARARAEAAGLEARALTMATPSAPRRPPSCCCPRSGTGRAAPRAYHRVDAPGQAAGAVAGSPQRWCIPLSAAAPNLGISEVHARPSGPYATATTRPRRIGAVSQHALAFVQE